MHFDSLAAFFAMGGHALYVWLAYGATALVLCGYAFVIRFRRKKLLESFAWQEELDGPNSSGGGP